MRQAGFSQLNLALVSSDKAVRETTKRPHTVDAYLKVVDRATRFGFKIVSYQILGLPNESLDSMIQTLAFNARLPVLLGASPFYLTPDAPIARAVELTDPDYVRARLTAMAVETEEFHRDDIYTLFVTTRIINFLKGLSVPHGADLMKLINQPWPETRTAVGFQLLRRLIQSQRLSFSTREGFAENRRFKTGILGSVLAKAGVIGCQNGRQIDVMQFASCLPVSSANYLSERLTTENA
jgi:hypothetical protein